MAPGRTACSACTRGCRSPGAPPSTPGFSRTGSRSTAWRSARSAIPRRRWPTRCAAPSSTRSRTTSASATNGSANSAGEPPWVSAGAASSGGRGCAVTLAPAERRAGICHDGRMESPFEVRVRPARLADHAALNELEAIAWSAESGFPSTMAADRRNATFFDAGNPPEAFLVAELDGRVVGYIRLKPPTKLPENAHVIQVQGLAVHPDARRRGVAAGLLDAAEEKLRERGTRKLTLRVLSTNEAAIRLYERHGFVREGTLLEEFCINGRFVDDVMMAKKL